MIKNLVYCDICGKEMDLQAYKKDGAVLVRTKTVYQPQGGKLTPTLSQREIHLCGACGDKVIKSIDDLTKKEKSA